MKCYHASFNVGKTEVWCSEFYFDKGSVLIEIELSMLEIVDAISRFSLLDENEIGESLNRAFGDLKKNGMFEEKKNQFDFFILEREIWKNYHQKNKKDNGPN